MKNYIASWFKNLQSRCVIILPHKKTEGTREENDKPKRRKENKKLHFSLSILIHVHIQPNP